MQSGMLPVVLAYLLLQNDKNPFETVTHSPLHVVTLSQLEDGQSSFPATSSLASSHPAL